MPISAQPTERSHPSAPTCQQCGVGCAHARSIHPQWQGEWLWCEHPHRRHTARLIRVHAECDRFQSAPARGPA